LNVVATQLWTRLASTAVQPQSQNQPGKFISMVLNEFIFYILANLQQLKNLKVEYQDGIAVVQFNQENSKVLPIHSSLVS
jgi:hypothetical protein